MCLFSGFHIPVQVFLSVCRALPLICNIIYLISLSCVCLFFSFTGATSQCECYLFVNGYALLLLHYSSEVVWVHSLVCLFSWCHIPVRVFVCVCARVSLSLSLSVHSFALNLQHYSSDVIWVHSLVFLYCWCHIPVRVFVGLCICSWFCPSFNSVHFACVPHFLVSYPSVIVCVVIYLCVCIALLFFLQHYFFDVVWVHSLVFFSCLCMIQVRVFFVCEWLCPSFFSVIHPILFGCIRLFFSFTGTTSQCECLCVCVCMAASLYIRLYFVKFASLSLFLVPHPSLSFWLIVRLCMVVPFF